MRWSNAETEYLRSSTETDANLTDSLNRLFGKNRTVEAVRKYRQRLKAARGDGVYRTNIGIIMLRDNVVYKFGTNERFGTEGILWGERLSGVDN